MAGEQVFGLFLLFGLVILGIRLLAGSFDRDRIRSEVARRGGNNVSIQWRPFGRGWFGEKGDRIYEVTYRDSAGGEHRAFAKTSMFSGVYFYEDAPIRPAPPPPAPAPSYAGPSEMERLREENERLKEELRRRGV